MASWFLAGWGGMREVTVTREMLAAKFGDILPHLDERQRRLLLGSEARALGHGGIRLVAAAAGAGEATVSRAVAASGPLSPIQGWSRRCWRWWSRTSGVTRNRRCGGRSSRPGRWPGS